MEHQIAVGQMAGASPAVRADYYKLFWIFLIGSVFGFACETIWCLFAHEHLEWHSSLIYIPFTAIYGCGALVLHLGTKNINKKRILRLFVFGAVSCSAAEYLCSLLQEIVFGTVSWDYSDTFLNIEGRVCLPLTIAWGILTVLWVWVIQPLFERFILNIPTQLFKPLSCILIAVILFFTVISIAAVSRWVMRQDGVPSTNVVTDSLDRLFTDDFMKTFYPKMKFGHSGIIAYTVN